MNPHSLLAAVEDVLSQGCDLLNSLDPEEYTHECEGSTGATIGAHYRHVLDHFQCLLDGLRTRQINYDQRRRSPIVETSLDAARVATEWLKLEFRRLPAGLLHQGCTVVYSVGYVQDGAEAVPSNVEREVMFCVGHAIHHYAILKLLCAEVLVALPYEFGVAPSTLRHLQAQATQ
jgi:DinB family protein